MSKDLLLNSKDLLLSLENSLSDIDCDKCVGFPCGKIWIEQSVQHEYVYLLKLPFDKQALDNDDPIFIDKTEDSCHDDDFIIYLSEGLWPLHFTFIHVQSECLWEVEIDNTFPIPEDHPTDAAISLNGNIVTVDFLDSDTDESLAVSCTLSFDRVNMTLNGEALKPIKRWSSH